jgi:hypothetical protein
MRKSILALSIAGIFGFSTMVLADAQTHDSTNPYSPASQNVEKLHQKPMANDSENATPETKKHRPHTKAKKSDAQKDLEDRAAKSESNDRDSDK